jgi:quercetin 2,3-dioxygenase
VVVEIRRGTDRFVEREAGRRTTHAFSFGATYDEAWVRFGPMVCHDEHLLRNGDGFADHEHSGLVIVTWVVSGALRHTSPGSDVLLEAGQCAVLHTGAGVTHAEMAAAPQTRWVQTWLATDPTGDPSYEVVTPPVTPLPGCTFSVARLEEGQSLLLPAAPRLHAFVARGALTRSSLAEPLHVGDAFLFTDEPPHEVTAGVETELLVWELT